jgi:S1-C subfamily serine protease
MIPRHIIQRVMKIKHGDGVGTAFTLEVDAQQYLITAKHVVKNLKPSDTVEVLRDGQWQNVAVSPIWCLPEEVDIAVLRPSSQLAPWSPTQGTEDELIYGQDVFFLGFPLGLMVESGQLNYGLPFPLVKKGCVSAMVTEPSGARYQLIDGHNLPGFSGGPIVYRLNGIGDFRICGVVAGYVSYPQPVHLRGQGTNYQVQVNTGLLKAYAIDHAIHAIKHG